MPKIWNKRHKLSIPPPDAVYVGRPSSWGNPFVTQQHTKAGHAEVVGQFRNYAEDKLKKEPDWLKPLKGKDLICWCSPLPCHAEVLMEMANR
jgi:hypothetical protein